MPQKLPNKPTILWTHDLTAKGLGGVAATSEYVIVSDRELSDSTDVWKCLSAKTGKEIWTVRYPALGSLDYGNSPRATPVIQNGLVYLAGAFGNITCVELTTGKIKWELNILDEFEPQEKPKWGTCSTPLLVGGKLIVNPGAKDASLVALDAKTGKILWKTPGKQAGYGSFILAKFADKEQIIGHDAESLGGFDPETGKRLWTVTPERPHDFNVPTPIPVGDKLLVATENNGTRLFGFDKEGKIIPKPLAMNRKLAPDTHTPVVAGKHVIGIWRRLFCLDIEKLQLVYDEDDRAFTGHCSCITDGQRVLILSGEGELLLLDGLAEKFTLLSRLKILDGEKGGYAHPALVGKKAYVRGSSSIVCIDLDP